MTSGMRRGQLSLIPEEKEIYCLDSDALINLRNAKLVTRMRRLVGGGIIKIPNGVYRECRRSRPLYESLTNWNNKYELIVDIDRDSAALSLLPDIERKYGPEFRILGNTYPGFWRSPGGRKSADSQVVALAKSRNWIVISNDFSIKGACLSEKVLCRGWEEIAIMLM